MTLPITVAPPPYERVLVEGILADLAVTDRVYFDLRHGQPLVEELVRRVGALRQSGSILVIAPNELLPRALLDAGHEVALWTVPQATVADDLKRHTTRTGVLDDLLDGHGDGRQYDAILLPYALEAATDDPGAILGRLRTSLRPEGSIVLACRHSGALGARWRAVRGHALLRGPNARRDHVSLSWPSLPARRVIDPEDLQSWSHQAGLRPVQLGFVSDTRATVPVKAMPILPWIGANALHAAQRLVPPIRDCLVATLTPIAFAVGRGGRENSPTEAEVVTVVVAVRDPQRANRVREDLARQTYPVELVDVILLDAKSGHGPAAANATIARARGDIVAFTDDDCRLPADWVEAGVTGLTGATAAVTGRLQVAAGSVTPFLELPGARALLRDEGIFSSANTFYRRLAILEAGGFDERFQSRGRVRWGWDSDLAHRLRANGYRIDFIDNLRVTRAFGKATKRGDWIGEEFRRALDLPGAVKAVPGLRPSLAGGLFASKRTLAFDLLLAGVGLALLRRRPVFTLLAIPWLRAVSRHTHVWPPAAWKPSGRHARGMAVRHVIWFAGLVAGSVKARRAVL